jgi:hypothetical protein
MGLLDLPSDDYEAMIDFMRRDLESGMELSKQQDEEAKAIEGVARKMFEAEGRDFDKEFKEWQADGSPMPKGLKGVFNY